MSADLDKILQIRYYVLILGQANKEPWWSSTFLTATGQRYLATPFPKSAFWAALHASSIAASRHHDERIGSAGTIHLFRLGQELELRLRDKVLRDGWKPQGAEADPSACLETLKSLSDLDLDVTIEGPIRVSDTKRFTAPKSLAQTAAYYAHAFEAGSQILPYGSEK